MACEPNKRRVSSKQLILTIVVILVVILSVNKVLNFKENKILFKEFYVSSENNEVVLYSYDEKNKNMSKSSTIYRGTKVKSNEYAISILDDKYIEIILPEGEKSYINERHLIANKEEIVKEKELYVRTSVTVYKNEFDSKILSFIKKGNKLDIIDYDYIDELGNVNMYKIINNDIVGWVYSKYLSKTAEDATANYNENGVYDIHKDRKYMKELYGGKASTLDYYPVEKKEFPTNPLLKKAKAMYLNASSTVISKIDDYLDIAKSSGVNAIVVDIKDGALAYPSKIAEKYSTTAYNNAMNQLDTYQSAIKKIKESDIYVIGRIVVFNDPHYGKDHKEECIVSDVSTRLWPSAYSRNAWEYNVELAKEAIDLMGFNEIQFDYVRFPEDAYEMSKSSNTDFKNIYQEEKAETIQNFLIYATDEIHKKNAYVSVDVFGESSGTYVTSYGQYWPAISNIVDVISSMPYTDHFGRTKDTWTDAYKTVNDWAKSAAKRQTEIPSPAIARTWITAYDTPHWNPTVIYDETKISDQARALIDAGLTGGFITWNSTSNLNKYKQIKNAFAKDYA